MKDKFYSNVEQLTYDDVLLVPRKTSVVSRRDVNLESHIGSVQLRYPIMSAAMDTVTGKAMASELGRVGGMGIIHRFQSVEERIECAPLNSSPVGIAVGLNESRSEIVSLAEVCDVIALDVAHAHASYVIKRTEELSEWLEESNVQLMVGNLVTREAALDLMEAGADILKVGIGGGSACSTRIVTGMGYPNISAIMEVRKAIDTRDFGKLIMLVADGGIRNSGDIAKAIAAGADCVMVGGMLAGCDESPGKICEDPYRGSGHSRKMFRGMASESAQDDWKGGLKTSTVAEGVTSYVDASGPVENIIMNLMGGLRSAFTYADARNIEEFQQYTKFIRVTANCLDESKPRV